MTEYLERLKQVASKQNEWSTLDATAKASLLQQMLDEVKAIGIDGYNTLGRTTVQNMMGIPLDTSEGKCETALQTLIMVMMLKAALEKYHEAYQVRAGMITPPDLPTRITSTGQVVVKVAPITSADKFAFASCCGELYLDPMVIKEESQVKTFDFDYFDTHETGATLILGAGNQPFLAFSDALHALFQCNCVTYVKLSPLRGYMEGIMRRIFRPLIERDYFDVEVDAGVERSQQLLYSSFVTHVHMTGGKATHDAIVWGSQTARKKPVLKATMTSELGCVTPWLVVPGEYTKEELERQAKLLAASVYSNASANCNAPKVVLLSEEWSQRQEFISAFLTEWESYPSPCTWYPGAKGRWEAFQKAYPNARVVQSKATDVEDRRLSTPLLGKDGPLALPLLVTDVDVDMSTDEGRKAASREYAFRIEPFAPVLTFATISGEGFLESAEKLCNEYLFGSLSCSITVPTALDGSEEVESLISSLNYGVITLNCWSGMAYAFMGLTWGAFPGECLEDVESGIGRIKNTCYVPHVQKSVLRTPLVDKAHTKMEHNLEQKTRELDATARFLLNPGVLTFVNLLVATVAIPSLPDMGRERMSGESLLVYWVKGLLGIIASLLHIQGRQIEKAKHE